MVGRSVSLDEAIWHLLKGARVEGRISDLAGSWNTHAELVNLVDFGSKT